MIWMTSSKRTVLLADDNIDLTVILRDYLDIYNQDDFEIIGVAHNGSEAIDMIVTKQPDIVLLDIIMPHINGMDVLKILNSMNLEKRPHVIVISGVSDNKTIQKALDLGAVNYINKPFDMNMLISKISKEASKLGRKMCECQSVADEF
jgi:two-component system, response regulator, stage 0 sporulation protein A